MIFEIQGTVKNRFATALVGVSLASNVFALFGQAKPAKSAPPAKVPVLAKPSGTPSVAAQHNAVVTPKPKGPMANGGGGGQPKSGGPKSSILPPKVDRIQDLKPPKKPVDLTPKQSQWIAPKIPKGSWIETTHTGVQLTRRSDDRLSDVHNPKSGVDVHYGLDRSRRIMVERKDGSRLVAERGRPGYVEVAINSAATTMRGAPTSFKAGSTTATIVVMPTGPEST